LLRNVGLSGLSFWVRAIHGQEKEEKKSIVQKDFLVALSRCMAHVIPILATTTLAYLNLAGYFIGGELAGIVGSQADAVDQLCLQVTAKLLVGAGLRS